MAITKALALIVAVLLLLLLPMALASSAPAGHATPTAAPASAPEEDDMDPSEDYDCLAACIQRCSNGYNMDTCTSLCHEECSSIARDATPADDETKDDAMPLDDGRLN